MFISTALEPLPGHVQSHAAAGPRQGGAAALLAALPQPLMLLLPDRRLLLCNGSAAALLASGWGETRAGHLMALGQLGGARLHELLQLAAAGSSSRTGLWCTPSLATACLHAAPLASSIAQAGGWPEPAVLLTLHPDQPALTQAARIDALSRQCRLTEAERHVLLLLADGSAADGVARLLGLRLSTVRSHVRHLLGKTQAASLMQLLRWTGSAGGLPG